MLDENTSSDVELVQLVRNGDKQAFDLLVIKYQYRIMKLSMRYCHDISEASDITQESFIKAYRAIDNFRGDSSFYTWLYRIAMNTAKTYCMNNSRKMVDQDVDTIEYELFVNKGLTRDLGVPDRQTFKDELETVVHEAIEHLPKDLQTAITLREIEGLSYDEIAGVMCCPVGTIRSRIFRAREIIEKRLGTVLTRHEQGR